MNTDKPLLNMEKLDYIAPVARITDIEIKQAFLQQAGSVVLPGGGDDGGGW